MNDKIVSIEEARALLDRSCEVDVGVAVALHRDLARTVHALHVKLAEVEAERDDWQYVAKKNADERRNAIFDAAAAAAAAEVAAAAVALVVLVVLVVLPVLGVV